MVLLEVALDFLELGRALHVARETRDYADIIEAGTPLIKAEGMRAVEALKGSFPDKQVFADLKVMDAGALEAGMAFDAGADMVSVCAQASAETVAEVVGEARRRLRKVMIDLIGSSDWPARAGELLGLSPDYFCVHTGINEQRKGRRPLERLEGFVRDIHAPYCIAGGIRPEDIPLIMPYGPSIIIVGGYITKAGDPREAARAVREAMGR
jgi:3-hexulose-6-phosphate synthase